VCRSQSRSLLMALLRSADDRAHIRFALIVVCSPRSRDAVAPLANGRLMDATDRVRLGDVRLRDYRPFSSSSCRGTRSTAKVPAVDSHAISPAGSQVASGPFGRTPAVALMDHAMLRRRQLDGRWVKNDANLDRYDRSYRAVRDILPRRLVVMRSGARRQVMSVAPLRGSYASVLRVRRAEGLEGLACARDGHDSSCCPTISA